MTPTHQRLPHLAQLGPQPLGRRLPLHDEAPAPVLPTTDVGEAQERERLRLALPALLPVLGGEPPEFDQSRLLGVQSQAELLQATPEFSEEAFGIAAVLEPHDEIVGIAHDDHVARGGPGPPLLDPQVEGVRPETSSLS